MIKRYPTPEAYAAAGVPTDESRVAQIEQSNEILIDGVNVVVPVPGDGDAVFEDAEGNPRFVRYDTINKSLLDPSWTHIGFAFGCNGRSVHVMWKDEHTGLKWLNCWQHTITEISAATIKFYLHMAGNYVAWVPIEVALPDASNGYQNANNAGAITTALEAAGNSGNIGYAKHGWWAFFDGTNIIVQCDLCADYRQNQTSDGSHPLVGCTMASSVLGDMPASTALWRRTGVSTSQGVMNVDSAVSYFSTNGKTPTANWPLNSVDYVTRAAFDSSAYCADLRAAYGTYENYIAHSRVMWPHPRYGVFKQPDAETMTARYGSATFTKKDGTDSVKFPALNYATGIGFGSGEFAVGKWHLSDVTEGIMYMDDVVYAKLREAQTRMNTVALLNSQNRWYSRMYNANSAWFFGGSNGLLNGVSISVAGPCRAVALLKF